MHERARGVLECVGEDTPERVVPARAHARRQTLGLRTNEQHQQRIPRLTPPPEQTQAERSLKLRVCRLRTHLKPSLEGVEPSLRLPELIAPEGRRPAQRVSDRVELAVRD